MNAAFEHISLYALGDWIGEALGDHVRRFQNCNEQFTTEIHDSFWQISLKISFTARWIAANSIASMHTW